MSDRPLPESTYLEVVEALAICEQAKQSRWERAAANDGRASDFAFGYVQACEEIMAALATLQGLSPVQATPEQMPQKPPSLAVALNMCREANSEAILPTPACWDLALYVERLEKFARAAIQASGGTPPAAAGAALQGWPIESARRHLRRRIAQ